MSVEIRHDGGRVWCDYGDISATWAGPARPGIVTGMGPLLLVRLPHEAETAAFERVGVRFTVTDGMARTEALNGTWLHRLESAHWRDPGVIPDGWAPRIMLGRWPD